MQTTFFFVLGTSINFSIHIIALSLLLYVGVLLLEWYTNQPIGKEKPNAVHVPSIMISQHSNMLL